MYIGKHSHIIVGVNIDELIETAQVIINDSSAIQADMAMYSKRYAALAAENAKVLKDYV